MNRKHVALWLVMAACSDGTKRSADGSGSPPPSKPVQELVDVTKLKLHRVEEVIHGVGVSIELPDVPACLSSGDQTCLRRSEVMHDTVLWGVEGKLDGRTVITVEVGTASPDLHFSEDQIKLQEQMRAKTVELLQQSYGAGGDPVVTRRSLPDGVLAALAPEDGKRVRVLGLRKPSWDLELTCTVEQDGLSDLKASIAWGTRICESLARK